MQYWHSLHDGSIVLATFPRLHTLKIELYRFFILNHISVDNADLVDVILAQLAWNLGNVSAERLKAIRSLIVIAHPAGRHEV